MLTISHQVAITGAASGMGLATAKLLASRGAIISLADINEKALEHAIESLPNSEKHMTTAIDVRNRISVDGWIQSTVDRLGKLDGAVNMAGIITPAAPIKEETDENWDFTFSVNTRGVFFCLRAELNAMKAGGSIVSPIPVSDLKDTMLKPFYDRSLLQVFSVKWVHPVSRPTALAKQLLLVCRRRQQKKINIFESTVFRQVSIPSVTDSDIG